MNDIRARIAGVGVYAPAKAKPNADLSTAFALSEEELFKQTGVKERFIAKPDMASSDFGVKAARQALTNANTHAETIDLVVCATVSSDYIYPATAALIQAGVGASNAFVFDVNAAGAGFVYALETAREFIESGRAASALVVAAETLSRFTDTSDKHTAFLFGDGAAAAVLTATNEDEGIYAADLGSDGAYSELAYIPAGGSKMPASTYTVIRAMHTIKMNVPKMAEHSAEIMFRSASCALKKAHMSLDDMDVIITSQITPEATDQLKVRFGANGDKVRVSALRYGNVASASIGLALNDAIHEGALARGGMALLLAFGAGITWGSMVLKY